MLNTMGWVEPSRKANEAEIVLRGDDFDGLSLDIVFRHCLCHFYVQL